MMKKAMKEMKDKEIKNKRFPNSIFFLYGPAVVFYFFVRPAREGKR
jgi:hypothetical protein